MSCPDRSSFFRRVASAVILSVGIAACSSGTAPQERILTFEVAATRVPCTGEGPMMCLQVREPGESAWRFFYDPIEGFTHEAGYRYTLRVARRSIANPPADGSSAAYRLVEMLARVAVP